MLGGVNDDIEHAEQLGRLLEGRAVATVNLIPYNPTGVGVAFSTSNQTTVNEFQMVLRKKFRINTTVRQQMGQDIDGACGQLVIAGGGSAVRDIEDIGDASVCQPQSTLPDAARVQPALSGENDAPSAGAGSTSGGAVYSSATSPCSEAVAGRLADFLSRGRSSLVALSIACRT